MKIELLTEIFVNGEPKKIGDVVEVSEGDAQLLIYSNRAKAYSEPQTIESEPVAEVNQTEIKIKGKKK